MALLPDLAVQMNHFDFSRLLWRQLELEVSEEQPRLLSRCLSEKTRDLFRVCSEKVSPNTHYWLPTLSPSRRRQEARPRPASSHLNLSRCVATSIQLSTTPRFSFDLSL